MDSIDCLRLHGTVFLAGFLGGTSAGGASWRRRGTSAIKFVGQIIFFNFRFAFTPVLIVLIILVIDQLVHDELNSLLLDRDFTWNVIDVPLGKELERNERPHKSNVHPKAADECKVGTFSVATDLSEVRQRVKRRRVLIQDVHCKADEGTVGGNARHSDDVEDGLPRANVLGADGDGALIQLIYMYIKPQER